MRVEGFAISAARRTSVSLLAIGLVHQQEYVVSAISFKRFFSFRNIRHTDEPQSGVGANRIIVSEAPSFAWLKRLMCASG